MDLDEISVSERTHLPTSSMSLELDHSMVSVYHLVQVQDTYSPLMRQGMEHGKQLSLDGDSQETVESVISRTSSEQQMTMISYSRETISKDSVFLVHQEIS